MGSILQDDEIIRLVRGAEDNDMISDKELQDLITHLRSPNVGIKKLRHLMYVEMDDMPKSLTTVQKRILLYCFSNCDDDTTCNSYVQSDCRSTGPIGHQATSIHVDIINNDNSSNFITVQNLTHLTPYVSPPKSEAPVSPSKSEASVSPSKSETPVSPSKSETPVSPSKSETPVSPSKSEAPKGGSPISKFPSDDEVQNYIEEHEIFLMRDGSRVQVVKMRADGDCLFASVTHQIGSYTPYSQEHRLEIMKAREQTVEYLRRNWRTDLTIKFNILDSCNQSRLCEYSGTESGKIEEYLTNLEEGAEWGGIESLKALAEQHNVSIRVFSEDRTPFSVNPLSTEDPIEIKVAFRKALLVDDDGAEVENYWNHYDSVLKLLPRNENSRDQAHKSHDVEEEVFDQVKHFFLEDEWASYSHTEKVRIKNVYDRYLLMEQKGFFMKLPYFVLDYQKRLEKEKKKQQKAEKVKTPAKPTRKSSRITTDKTDAEESLPLHISPVQAIQSPLIPVKTKQPSAKTSATTKKKPLLFGKKLVYPTPLPEFGSLALLNLKKPAHSRNISPILFECKVFCRTHRENDYLGKSEYEDFARTLVEKYPLLGTDAGEKAWWTFKKSLSASFRDDRKRGNQEEEEEEERPKKKTTKKKTTKDVQQDDDQTAAETRVSSPDAHACKIKQLSEAKDKKVIAKLLVETKEYRRARYFKLSSAEKITLFPHLKDPNMFLLDYFTSNGFVFEDLEDNLLTNIYLIGEHYGIDVTSQAGRMMAIEEMHAYFLTPAVKKGAKPVFTIVDERSAIQALISSGIQSPFLVVHIKKNPFLEEENELDAAAIGMEGRMLLAINNSPNAVRCLMTLVAVYNLFELEYPQAYMEFMRALERFITGSVVKSKYGQTKKKFDTFLSMIKTKGGKKPNRKNNNKKK